MNEALGEFLAEMGHLEFEMLLYMDRVHEAPLEHIFDDISGKPFAHKIKRFKDYCNGAGVREEHKIALRGTYVDLDALLPKRNYIVHGETRMGAFHGKHRQAYRLGLEKKNLEYLDEFDRGEHGPNIFDVGQIREAARFCSSISSRIKKMREETKAEGDAIEPERVF